MAAKGSSETSRAPRRKVSHDAITLLKKDHEALEKLFRKFEAAHRSDRQPRTAQKRSLADRIISTIQRHTTIEQSVFYPTVRAEARQSYHLVMESYEEHHVVDILMAELSAMDAADERFDPKMLVLIALVRDHRDVEENDLFPIVRKALGRKRLSEIGMRMENVEAGVEMVQDSASRVQQVMMAGRNRVEDAVETVRSDTPKIVEQTVQSGVDLVKQISQTVQNVLGSR